MEYEALKSAIERVMQVYIKEIHMDSKFEADFGTDSIDLTQIFKCVEETLKIKINDVDLESIVTVEDALKVIQQSMNK